MCFSPFLGIITFKNLEYLSKFVKTCLIEKKAQINKLFFIVFGYVRYEKKSPLPT